MDGLSQKHYHSHFFFLLWSFFYESNRGRLNFSFEYIELKELKEQAKFVVIHKPKSSEFFFFVVPFHHHHF